MNLSFHFREAMRNLVSSKLRSLLAILGILVGTAAVVTLISSSQMATANALSQFKRLGTNLLLMKIYPRQQRGVHLSNQKLNLSHIEKLASSNTILNYAPYTDIYLKFRVADSAQKSMVFGITHAFSDVMRLKLRAGRMISDYDGHRQFCVIGSELAKILKRRGYQPLGHQIKLHKHYFTVIGVLSPYQRNYFLYNDLNSSVLIPLKSSFMLEKTMDIRSILFRLNQRANISAVKKALAQHSKTLFPNRETYFRDPKELIDVVAKQRRTFTYLLGAIGVIALIVGGIGIMNIMLVAVVERRREIGVRLAVGARARDVLLMFLVEAILLTSFGGLLGIVVGGLASLLIAFLSQWQFHLYLFPLLLSFVIAVFVGISSGFYPALRAARLDPIQSLNNE